MFSYNPDKPVSRTRIGYPARLICKDRKTANSEGDQRVLVALVQESDGAENARTYFANGHFREGSEDIYDLVNRQEVDHPIYICEHRNTKEIRVFDYDPSTQGPKGNKHYQVIERTSVTFMRDL